MPDSVSVLLSRMARGEPHAAAELLPIVYAELRRLASREMARESPARTLQATALVHEAYLHLVGPEDRDEQRFESRAHFLGAAARAMRHVLIDAARARGAAKRDGGGRRIALDLVELSIDAPAPELIDLDEALERFASVHPTAARLVELRFFGGLTQAEAARALDLPPTTADRHWAYARSWLYQALSERDRDDPREIPAP